MKNLQRNFILVCLIIFNLITFVSCGDSKKITSIYVDLESKESIIVQYGYKWDPRKEIVIKAKLSDNSEIFVEADDCEFSDVDTNILGRQMMSVTYRTCKCQVFIDVIKIEIGIHADDESMYDFREKEANEQGNRMFELIVHFNQAVEMQYEREDGITEIRKCVHLTFMPKITYDSGDTANAEEEGIVYRLEHTKLQEEGKIDLTDRGELMCFKNKTSFRIYVEPETKGSYRAAIIIDVYVRN